MSSLAERLAEVRQRIEAAAAQAGRSSSEIQLIVVTKNHSPELVKSLYDLGARDFGENRDQEAGPKARELQTLLQASGEPDPAVWHFVGQLQSNKVKNVLSYASTLHSLDRASLLRELCKQLDRLDCKLECFIQLNLTDDSNRGGVEPKNLVQFAEAVLLCERVNLLGLMAVADPKQEPEREFARVVSAREVLLSISPTSDKLSIGMSGDFEQAIRQGATHLRIGSAITQSVD
ncbi:MAG: hypothetical protein RL198_863 [Actinomycetota bacterium]